MKPEDDPYPSSRVSTRSFGHSGYTGTFVWADPETEVLYIFFTNRVYPTRNNNMLSQLRIRGAMLDAINDALGSYKPEN
jgi:CubicO group peptidase (beta-lactamase class C family)